MSRKILLKADKPLDEIPVKDSDVSLGKIYTDKLSVLREIMEEEPDLKAILTDFNEMIQDLREQGYEEELIADVVTREAINDYIEKRKSVGEITTISDEIKETIKVSETASARVKMFMQLGKLRQLAKKDPRYRKDGDPVISFVRHLREAVEAEVTRLGGSFEEFQLTLSLLYTTLPDKPVLTGTETQEELKMRSLIYEEVKNDPYIKIKAFTKNPPTSKALEEHIRKERSEARKRKERTGKSTKRR